MRLTKDEYYLMIAEQVKNRGTCLRARIGAIIVRDEQIVATGYLGSPRQTKDCLERNECLRDKLNIPHGQRYELCRSVHAEQNCILNAARAGVSILNGDMYIYAENQKGEKTDGLPCFICKKMIINAGLKRVICSTKEGKMKIFNVEDWTRDWQEKDIVDDQQQYGKDQNK
ncbi:MAG: dCMP deaminase family protein [Patescibacteria group bacterium]|jgi:dCMP deaminase